MTSLHPFDLQERAALAARSLTALLDGERGGLMYFLADWQAHPPRADHCLWDYGDGSGRQVDALTLVRTMVPRESRAAQPDSGDLQLEDWMIRQIGDDGLTWLPLDPWALPWEPDAMLVDWHADEPVAEISWAQRGTLMGLISRYLRTSDDRYLTLAEKMIDGLLRAAERDSHGLVFPEGYYRRSGWRYQGPHLHRCLEIYNAAVAVPAARFYEITGYGPALELAHGLVSFALYHTEGYLPDGTFRPSTDNIESHFHTHSNFILSVLKLGLLEGRREYVAWARQSYEQAKAWGTDFGWFPEGLGMRHGEICCTTDMIEIALLLGRHVDRRYFADAERFGRNHLLESQFLSGERLAQALERLPAAARPAPHDGRYSTCENVAESQVGGFASRSTLNDQFHLDAAQMMQCCNGAGARALYDLWRYAVHCTEEVGDGPPRQSVHLRFSVETPELRVVSYEPAEGRLDITARRACELAVRLPQGTQQALVVHQGNDTPQVTAPPLRDGYLYCHVGTMETVAVYYPLLERQSEYEVGREGRTLRCTGTWRGETLMRIDPPGHFYPLYDRSTDLEPVQPSLPAHPPIESL